MNQKEQILKIAKDLSSLGVKPGDVLFTHSSLSSMGKVEGGCETVIRGMEEAVGGEGIRQPPDVLRVKTGVEYPQGIVPLWIAVFLQ